jgi:hypothetical protein
MEQFDDIDFANSKSDSYNATSDDVMNELNAYFKSYITNVNGNKDGNIQETLDGIFNGSSFDDAIEAIHRERDSSPTTDEFNGDIEQNVLDVEILDQHIDKYGLTGGSDATRAIENMAGGSLNGRHGRSNKGNIRPENDFANSMLGIHGGDVRIDGPGLMKGYSGVTNEIRVKGKRVTERDRTNVTYRSENGHLNLGMLGGSFEENEDWEDPVTDTDTDGPTHDDDYSDGYSQSEFEEEDDNDNDSPEMTSEIDLVLNQLRNKAVRTLTGGTVNIRKKVVLTDMYPYIIRS